MHIEARNAVVALLTSPDGADMMTINIALRPWDIMLSPRLLFAFCVQEDIWLKIDNRHEDGSRYYGLDPRDVARVLYRRISAPKPA